ncbi:hypothetical protein G6L08_33175 [Agrobacterium rhizogenes]|nr:hypothetical protein [Rhizobium rhizogenes]NTG32006.1 hypothetical protein [Rhizobium rhizogenes]
MVLNLAGNRLRRPLGLQSVDDELAQGRMASELAQPSSALSADVIDNRIEVTHVLEELTIMEDVVFELTVNCRAISPIATLRSLR